MSGKTDVIIIGAGASGMMAAVTAAKNNKKVLVIEHLSKVLKKIPATGNGKCNFTNLHIDDTSFRGENKEFAYNAVKSFSPVDTVEFFKQNGLIVKDRDGYMYPFNEQATAIRDLLIGVAENYGVEILTETEITGIKKDDALFAVSCNNGKTFKAAKLILACGGKAAKTHGSDGSGFALAERFGHSVVPLHPALCGLNFAEDDKLIKKLQGVRAHVEAKVEFGNKVLTSEHGEIIFGKSGISGIPIMQMSRFASAYDLNKSRLFLSVDFLPDVALPELVKTLQSIRKNRGIQCSFDAFSGILNNKLMSELMLRAGIHGDTPSAKINDKSLSELAALCKNFRLRITGTGDFDTAQCTAGGVSTSEIDNATMESKLCKGLFIVGEMLDIDGTCGGYNLQWAWTTGYLAGKSI